MVSDVNLDTRCHLFVPVNLVFFCDFCVLIKKIYSIFIIIERASLVSIVRNFNTKSGKLTEIPTRWLKKCSLAKISKKIEVNSGTYKIFKNIEKLFLFSFFFLLITIFISRQCLTSCRAF